MARERILGFTLAELLIVMALVAIVAAGALPAFNGLVERKRLTGAQHEFIGALAHMRQAAIARSRPVTLCPSRDGRTCLSRGQWHEGWISFPDRDGDRDRDAGEAILQDNRGLDGVTLTSSKYRRRVTFQPTGTAGGSNATFTLCVHGNPEKSHAVILSRLGRARVADTGPGGRALNCP